MTDLERLRQTATRVETLQNLIAMTDAKHGRARELLESQLTAAKDDLKRQLDAISRRLPREQTGGP